MALRLWGGGAKAGTFIMKDMGLVGIGLSTLLYDGLFKRLV